MLVHARNWQSTGSHSALTHPPLFLRFETSKQGHLFVTRFSGLVQIFDDGQECLGKGIAGATFLRLERLTGAGRLSSFVMQRKYNPRMTTSPPRPCSTNEHSSGLA